MKNSLEQKFHKGEIKMKQWKTYYLLDLARYGNNKVDREKKIFLKYFRKCQFSANGFLTFFNRFFFRKIKQKLNIEVFGKTSIGYGLYLGHPFGITINDGSVIGNNCNIHRGVLIGQENRGKRKGVPTIGNDVWIGINSAIVGKITIGDDVLIAPNTFINRDVPSHSIVFGNPCIIKRKENATDGYINNKVDA